MKKLIFVTIPMLNAESLKKIRYRKENRGELFSAPASFPSIPMIEWAVTGEDDIKIVAIMADDAQKRSEANLEVYKKELRDLSETMGVPLEIQDILRVPHEETREKQIQLFKEISKYYDGDSEIYMDVTYGTKVTSIGLFSSLIYAEKVRNCTIKSIVYGKYAHDGGDIGELYDLRPLYDLNMIIHAAEFMPEKNIDDLISFLWG